MVDVAGFYNGVINDVIEGMKDTFTQEGLDLDLLEQLRKLWSSKLAETHVADPEPVAQPAVHYAQRLQATQFQQACVGQQGMPISISRLPIQPNSLAGVGGVGAGGGMRTLAPIARPNAPLTMSAAAPAAGLVLRSAVGASVQAPGSTAGRPPIVLAAALNPQAAGVQPRLANPLAGIAIRAPLQASGPGQPGTATTATIIGQPTMASVNGVPAIPGQNVQILQVGQQTFMVPVQFRQPLGSAATTAQQLQDATNTTTTTILAAAPAPAPQQTHQQSFNRTQVDGVDDSDFDDDDDDVEVVEPYSVDTPSLRAPMSVATPHSVFSRTPGSAAQPLVDGSIGGVGGGGGGGSGGGGTATTATPGGDGEDDSDDDDADMVVATPGVAGSMLTPNPASVATVTSTTPTTPHIMLNSTKTSATAAATASTNSTVKRSYDTARAGTVAGSGSGGIHSRNRAAKRSRGSARVGKEFREFDDDLDDDIADDEEDEVDVDDEDEEEFGSVATMTPSGQRLEMLAAAAAASAEEAAMGGRSVSRRKQKTPTAVAGSEKVTVKVGGGSSEDDHIPDLPPPAPPPPQPPANGGDEKVSGGCGVGTEENAEETDGKGTGLTAEEEEEEEPLNSGDDVSDEEPESLFESDNLVVCQYDKVNRSRSKWRFWLRDGIMKIRGRDHLFQKLIVEADWLIVPANSVPAL